MYPAQEIDRGRYQLLVRAESEVQPEQTEQEVEGDGDGDGVLETEPEPEIVTTEVWFHIHMEEIKKVAKAASGFEKYAHLMSNRESFITIKGNFANIPII